jgi:A/G-specific adenine glycosylase
LNFTKQILNWFHLSARQLPWRSTRNPYFIWISEVILQQTRVAQGMNYYLRFIDAFPDVRSLAQADINDVLKVWQGLGYYSRARNLHTAANQIVQMYGGGFPDTYLKLIEVKGIGPYTAAAIASIAFKEQVAAIDGNVIRVSSRYFGLYTDGMNTKGRQEILNKLNTVIDSREPGNFNQAMMELGALVCKPLNPECTVCPLRDGCFAFKNERTTELPIPKRKAEVKSRFITYYVPVDLEAGNTVIQRRMNVKDIWYGLYEFVSEEADATNPDAMLLKQLATEGDVLGKYQFEHKLTHRNLYVSFIYFRSDLSRCVLHSAEKVKIQSVPLYAISRLTDRFIMASGFPGFIPPVQIK